MFWIFYTKALCMTGRILIKLHGYNLNDNFKIKFDECYIVTWSRLYVMEINYFSIKIGGFIIILIDSLFQRIK